jgi:hypothetical protein
MSETTSILDLPTDPVGGGGNNNLTLIGTDSKIIGADSTKFIITNGTGLLKIQNVGTTLRTSTIF